MFNKSLSVLLMVFAACTTVYAASSKGTDVPPPAWALYDRPAGAPLSVPAFEKIHATTQQDGSVKVIVRFVAPSDLPQGFQSEATIKDQVRVKAQQATIQNAQDKILKRLSKKHAEKSKRFKHIPFMALEVDAADLSILLSSPEIDSIEEDVPVPPTLTQSVPLLGGDGSGAFSGFTGAGQTVAILDTGVDKTHPFLAGKVIDEACFSSNYAPHAATTVCPNGQISQTGSGAGVNCNSAIAGCDHGTHVAGIAAGNGAGFSGVAKDASVLAVQVFSRFDANCGGLPTPCALTYSSDYTSALDWVYSKRSTYSIAAVNMSLGGGSNTTDCDAVSGSVKAAIDNLRSAGIATVIATGNNGYTNAIGSPACISTAVSV
uniref:S8 family peptidase n=1 Tax=Trichlorobacter lovleyi TaxID=313985 RepID=UPI0023EF8AC6